MDDYDQQIADGKLIVEKTTVVTPDGEQQVAARTTTVQDPLVQTVSLEDMQRLLGEFQTNRVDLANQMDTLDTLIDYYTKIIAAVSNGKH